jgi:enamine deaminase RidA (YjgF/YER057c/UK114 family)
MSHQNQQPQDEIEAAAVQQLLLMLRTLRQAGWRRNCIVQIEIRGRSVTPRVREVTLGAVTLTERPDVL